MAIKALAWMVRAFEPPVYCYHEIVHNEVVVQMFRDQGVIFVDDIADVPNGAPIMLSAHGSAPEVVDQARMSGGIVINAVCPLVTKVHHELKVRANKGYTIIYVGHEGHDEAVGAMAVAPESVQLVENIADVDALGIDDTPVALLAQTTLAHSEWADIQERARTRFPEMWMPTKSDLCFATTNRQSAIRELAPKVDVLIVLGSANSSNTLALARTATESGAAQVLRVNSADELPAEINGIVGITAGASAPEQLVQELIDHLQPQQGVEILEVTEEDEYFPVPRELRDYAAATAALARFAFAAPLAGTEWRDRDISAADVLADLVS